jgi:hypothetical protein
LSSTVCKVSVQRLSPTIWIKNSLTKTGRKFR